MNKLLKKVVQSALVYCLARRESISKFKQSSVIEVVKLRQDRVYTLSKDGRITLWSVDSPEIEMSHQFQLMHSAQDFDISPDERFILIATQNGMNVFSIPENKQMLSTNFKAGLVVSSIQWHASRRVFGVLAENKFQSKCKFLALIDYNKNLNQETAALHH